MALKYKAGKSNLSSIWLEWAKNHKTMICLSGGMDTNLKEILSEFEAQDNGEHSYPWSTFFEAEEAMDGMLTNIAVVLPERIYETASLVRSGEGILNNIEDGSVDEFTDFEIYLINLLNSCSLAR